MKIGLEAAAVERLDDLIRTFDRLIAVIEASTAAIGALNELVDGQLNGPRG